MKALMKLISVLVSFSLEETIDQAKTQAEGLVAPLRSALETSSATQALEDRATIKPLKSKSPSVGAQVERELAPLSERSDRRE